MSGGKRTNSSSKTTGQSDFKRLKAKVGKRALKPANVTDTSFRAASLHVAGQILDRGDAASSSSGILSSRGKSLLELTSQLGHPAAAVRLSAMKGLQNVVSSQKQSLRTHLSILVPTCSKSCVDEDADVRQVGLAVLSDLVTSHDETTLRPFASLLVAYATSALHSLDAPMRMDGARAVLTMARFIPSLIAPHQNKLLPPYISLLGDRTMAKQAEEILQSLLTLLKTKEANTKHIHDATYDDSNDPDLVILEYGRSCPALMLPGRMASHSIPLLERISELPSLDRLDSWNMMTKGTNNTIDQEGGDSTTHDLLAKLRDVLVEATGQGEDVVVATTAAMSMNKVSLVVQAIRWMWNLHAASVMAAHQNPPSQVEKLGQQILQMQLEIFPITQEDVRSSDHTRIDSLNADLCTTIMNMASSLPPSAECEWIEPLCSYLLPRLEKLAINQSTSAALDVFGALLLLRGDETLAANSLDMLERLHTIFFEKDDNMELARSPAGRKVALLIRDILKEHDYCMDDMNQELKTVLTQILQRLPSYLIAWSGDFLFETKLIVGLLHNVVRRIYDKEDAMLVSMRTSLSGIVFLKKAKAKTRERTVFEKYLVALQRQFLGLLVMLESPSEETITGLGTICARCSLKLDAPVVSETIADGIVESLNLIRKTLSMQSYLGFLISSTGINNTIKKAEEATDSAVLNVDVKLVVSFDIAIRRLCRALIQCGSAKILPMLMPLLSSWLAPSSKLSLTDMSIRTRSTISILALISLDLQQINSDASVFEIAEEQQKAVIQGISTLIINLSCQEQEEADRYKWTCPIVALIQSEPRILKPLFDHLPERIADVSVNQFAQTSTINTLIDLVKDQRLLKIICDSAGLVDAAHSFESKFGDGPLLKLSGRLRMLIALKTGAL
jgi:hypothetical protein